MVQTNVSMSDDAVECDECGYMYRVESDIFFREGGFSSAHFGLIIS
jgi:hypothetical protein